MVEDVRSIYAQRFQKFEIERNRIWQVLTRSFFQKWVKSTDAVLDVGSGYCEFINNIDARKKIALDLNPVAQLRALSDVKVVLQDISQTWTVEPDTMDVVFSSNFFEHLPSKQDVGHCLREAYRVLRPGGLIITMGPNIRFCWDIYWDFFDHYLPLSDRSMVEGLELAGFEQQVVIPRFLPFTMAGKRPPAPFLVRLYLSMPVFWRMFGRQFLVVARKPDGYRNSA